MDARLAPDQGRRRVSGTPGSTCSRRSRRTRSSSSPATFPTNNAIANLLLGAPVTFYQGLGDFSRGIRNNWSLGALRAGRVARRQRAHAELRAALRAHQPVHRGRGSAERVRARRAVAGAAGRAARACCSRATRASGKGIAQSANAFMPRVGVAWDPTGIGHVVGAIELRPLLRPVPERLRHRVAGRDQRDAVRRSSTSSAARASTSRTRTWAGPIRSPTRSCGRRRSSRSTWTPSRRTRRTGTWASSGRSSTATSSRCATSAPRARTCRATSKPTPRSSARAPRRRTPTGAASTPTVPPTAAPATSRPSRC